MCGIAVILSKQDTAKSYENILQQMLERMHHRGPDGQGQFVSDQIALGMKRLAIVDYAGGMQPIWNEDRTVCVVANGEIFNHHTLRQSLMENGHQFATGSDVEVLVHLYEQYGEFFLDKLEGIYAFAIWDNTKRKLLVVRDRTGVKPIYYMEREDAFVFSSEMDAMLAIPSTCYEVDKKAVSEYHGFRFVPAPRTIVRDILKLPPAHWAEVSAGQISIHKYWTPHASAVHRADNGPGRLLELFQQAVISQEAPEVKSGLFLSAGLDSSALLAMQTRHYQQQPLTFTVGFDKSTELSSQLDYDELKNAEYTAKLYGAEHASERYSAEQVLSELPRIIASLDEPVADPTAIPLWLVSKMAADAGCKVVYSGEGLDEIFYGYSVYNHAQWIEALRKLPAGFRQAALYLLKKGGLPGQGVVERSLHPISEWYQGIGGVFTAKEKKALFAPGVWEQLPPAQAVFPSAESKSKSVLKKMAEFDFYAWLPDNTLAKSDKVSMAHSLELRVPYLNHPIIEYAEQLPIQEKRRGKVGKWAARQAFHEILPQEIIARPKNGFPVPITAWIFGDWRDFVGDMLLNPQSKTGNIYNRAAVEKLLATESGQRRRAARLLWTLLTMEMWMNLHPEVAFAGQAKSSDSHTENSKEWFETLKE